MTHKPFWIIALLAVPIAAIAQDPKPLVVGERLVPVPDTVSPELKKAIVTVPAPQPPIPANVDAWRAMQKLADASAEKTAIGAAMLLGVKVDPADLGGVKAFRVTPKTIAPGKDKFLFFHVHGGSFVFNGGRGATAEAILLANAAQLPAVSIDYRRPPDHPYPAPVDDVLAAWKAVLKERDPATVVMGGSSAGGTLIMAALMRARAEKLAMPAAIFLGTPGADLSKTGDSVYLNEGIDRILIKYDGFLEAALKLYANGKDLKDPGVSPVYGDFSGFPPTILMSGTRDMLLSATVRTHRKLRAQGVTAELHVYEGQSHADYLLAYPAPETHEAMAEITRFFDRHLRR